MILDSLWHDGHPVCQTEEQAEAIMKMMADAESEEARIKAQYQERLAQVKAKRNKLDFLYKSV
ncbi:MAG: hypothetical protein GTN65_01975, partial [Armatimonadetes bacterium]|nr:hypothetical protein [Armatimonadota bacterium]NIO95875.1 hypothetical protein [Armatimonadota bacterium]